MPAREPIKDNFPVRDTRFPRPQTQVLKGRLHIPINNGKKVEVHYSVVKGQVFLDADPVLKHVHNSRKVENPHPSPFEETYNYINQRRRQMKAEK